MIRWLSLPFVPRVLRRTSYSTIRVRRWLTKEHFPCNWPKSMRKMIMKYEVLRSNSCSMSNQNSCLYHRNKPKFPTVFLFPLGYFFKPRFLTWRLERTCGQVFRVLHQDWMQCQANHLTSFNSKHGGERNIYYPSGMLSGIISHMM